MRSMASVLLIIFFIAQIFSIEKDSCLGQDSVKKCCCSHSASSSNAKCQCPKSDAVSHGKHSNGCCSISTSNSEVVGTVSGNFVVSGISPAQQFQVIWINSNCAAGNYQSGKFTHSNTPLRIPLRI